MTPPMSLIEYRSGFKKMLLLIFLRFICIGKQSHFLWSCTQFKAKFSNTKPGNIEVLHKQIKQECRRIYVEVIRSVLSVIQFCLEYFCQLEEEDCPNHNLNGNYEITTHQLWSIRLERDVARRFELNLYYCMQKNSKFKFCNGFTYGKD